MRSRSLFCSYLLIFCSFFIFSLVFMLKKTINTKTYFNVVSLEVANLSCHKFMNHKVASIRTNKIVLEKAVFPGDLSCENFTKRLYEDDTFDPTPLVSYPGSGNTWMRHLIELSSGIYTGSVYTDVDLILKGFLGEKEPSNAGSTVVQKTHEIYSKKLNVTKAILIIRDPYKAVVSFVQYLESGHVGQASPITFKRKEWSNFMLAETYKWISLAKSWLESPVNILVVHYEDLIGENKILQLGEICNFLNIPCPNLHTKCFKNHKDGLFKRKRKLHVHPEFPMWVRHKTNRGIDYLNNLLIHQGHSPLPLEKYEYYIEEQVKTK